MNLEAIKEENKRLKEAKENLIKYYKASLMSLKEAYLIAETTNHYLAPEIKTFVDNMENGINNLSKSYTEAMNKFDEYLANSDGNYEQLEKDIYTISKNLADSISRLE